ncbi:O-antigen ligase family protein [Desulfotignum balticum]|uniref:O-antigen ligase family protein n=1 Tax=Desulfotignum balticum TaxID=115781 RepID=UPI000462949D|nr:O-antigen ligase family protein [Desulfotignum balticum]
MKPYFQHLHSANKYLLVLFGFCIPVSTALTNVVLGLVVLVWLLDNGADRFARWGRILKSNPVAMMGLAVFLMHVIGLFYSDGDKEKIIESLSDGAKFLFIGMVMVYFTDKKFHPAFLLSFISAMGLILLLSSLLWVGLLPDFISVKGDASNCVVFHDHIKQNIFMAFAAFVAAIKARNSGTGPVLKWLWAGFSLLAMFNVLFLVGGRTGHVILVVLALYYFLTWDRSKSLIAGVLIVVLFGTFAWYNPSNLLFVRAQEVIEEVRKREYDSYSSSGLRLEWFFNSLNIIKQNPVVGSGTGSFKTIYDRFVEKTEMKPTDNPHNEYLMTAVQFGLAGLLVLLGFFAVQWRQTVFFEDRGQKLMARGFVLLMLIACMTASPLQDNAEGWFFVFMSGLFFAGCHTNEAASASEKVKEQHI